jgi:predicted RNA-binding Zn-ribbon protein involved in translation (DUF1610 family)
MVNEDLVYNKLSVILSCDNCGLSFPTQEALDTLSFSHTFSTQAEIYRCPSCGGNEVRVIRESKIEHSSYEVDDIIFTPYLKPHRSKDDLQPVKGLFFNECGQLYHLYNIDGDEYIEINLRKRISYPKAVRIIGKIKAFDSHQPAVAEMILLISFRIDFGTPYPYYIHFGVKEE